MDNNNKESKQDKVDETTGQPAPVDEKNDNQEGKEQTPTGEDEKVTLSRKELEDLQKRATDFDRSIELKRLSKLDKTKNSSDNSNEVIEELAKLREEISSFKAQSYNNNLSEAYREFIKENPWADSDEKFDKIRDNFNSVGTETKEELHSRMKTAAQIAFPNEYEKHLEDRIKARVLSDKSSLNSGGAAGSANILHKDDNKHLSEEEKTKARLESKFKSFLPPKR